MKYNKPTGLSNREFAKYFSFKIEVCFLTKINRLRENQIFN